MRSVRLTKLMAILSLVFLAATALTSSRAAADSPTAWTPELMLKVNTIPSVRPSPDGKKVAFTVAEPVMTAERSEYVTQIHLANADFVGPTPSQTSHRLSPVVAGRPYSRSHRAARAKTTSI